MSTDAQLNKAIELHAEDMAFDYFKQQGWSARKIGKPYDLRCMKGDEELHVEVKGSSGLGKTIVLTVRESPSRKAVPNVALVVVTNIKCARKAARLSAGEETGRCGTPGRLSTLNSVL